MFPRSKFYEHGPAHQVAVMILSRCQYMVSRRNSTNTCHCISSLYCYMTVVELEYKIKSGTFPKMDLGFKFKHKYIFMDLASCTCKLLLQTIQENLVGSFQNTCNFNKCDQFRMIAICSKLRSFKTFIYPEVTR